MSMGVDALICSLRSRKISARGGGENGGHLVHATRQIAPQHLSRQGAGVDRILDHRNSVHQDGRAVSAWILMRVGVGRAITKIISIEDSHVSPIAFAQETTIAQLERLRGRSSHFMDGAFKRE